MLLNLARSAKYIVAGSFSCTKHPKEGKCASKRHPVNSPTAHTGGFNVIDLMQPPYSLVPWTSYEEHFGGENKVLYVFRQHELLAALRERMPVEQRDGPGKESGS